MVQPEIPPLNQELAHLKQQLAARDETIEAKNRMIKAVESDFRSKIADLEQRLRDTQQELQIEEAKLKEKDTLLQATAAKEVEMGNLIKRLSGECEQLNRELQEISQSRTAPMPIKSPAAARRKSGAESSAGCKKVCKASFYAQPIAGRYFSNAPSRSSRSTKLESINAARFIPFALGFDSAMISNSIFMAPGSAYGFLNMMSR